MGLQSINGELSRVYKYGEISPFSLPSFPFSFLGYPLYWGVNQK